MNKYIGLGNLTQDPICKDLGESKVCNFGLAVNEYYYKEGKKQQNTVFIDIESWNKQAENCNKFLKKGSKVLIEGKLKTNSWEKNGQKYTKIFCLADKVHFLASDSTEDQQASSKPKVKKELKKVEKVEEDIDDIEYEDIPF